MASRLFAVDLDLGLNKAKQFVFEDFLTDPTSATGRVYYNGTGNRLKVYNGTAWKSVAWTDDVVAGTTYAISAETSTGGANLRLTGSDSTTDDVKIAAGSNVTVTRTDANTITISSSYTDTDTNTTYSQAAVTTTGGAFLRLTGSDSTTDDVKFAGSGATTVAYTDANTITISSTDTNTTYSAATSSVSGLIKLFSDTVQSTAANAVSSTASRTYGVQLNSSGQAVVNVPWSDTDTNTTYDLTSTGTTTASINLVPSSGVTDSVTITGSGATSVSHSAGAITISSTDTDTNYYPSAIVFNAGTTAGPTLDLTMSGSGAPDLTAVAIPSASATASGIVTTGAQEFGGAKTFKSNVIIDGDLTVSGNTVTLDVASLLVEDNIIILNKNVTGVPSTNAGIEVERGDSTNASITWNETTEFWTAGLAGSEIAIARKYSETINTTGGTAYTVTHNLGTSDVVVQTYVSGSLVDCDVDITNGNAITVTTNATTSSVKVVVIG